MEDYYSILNVDKNATKKDIKNAYYKLIRKYTPEKNPDEFEKIRKAYEVLIDDKSRKEYDMEKEYGDEINNYLELANKAMENHDFKTAIKQYKKILLIYPSLDFVKNQLALALAYNNQISEALKQLKELVEKYPNNCLYLNNLAKIYLEDGNIKLAEEYFLKVYKMQPTNLDYIYNLENLYIKTDRMEEAVKFLKNCINKNQDDKEFIILCYFRLLRIYIIQRNQGDIQEIIKILKSFINDKQYKLLITETLKDLCLELYEAELYFMICIVLEQIISDLNDEELEDIYKDSCKLDELLSLYSKLENDKRIIGPLIGPIYYFIYGGEMDEDEYNDSVNKNIDAINSYLTYESSMRVIDSINIIKSNYSKLYEFTKKTYDEIYKIAKDKNNIYNKFKKLENDTTICNPVKKLIALWMMEDITQDERQNYFSQIMKEMEYETDKDIYISIENIQRNYDVLYNLNKLALEDLKNIVRKNIEIRGEKPPNTDNKNTRTKTTSENTYTKQTNNINNHNKNENINQNTNTKTNDYKDNKYNDMNKKYNELKNNIEIFLGKYRKTIVPAILMSLLTIVFIIAMNTSNSDGNSDDAYDYQQEEVDNDYYDQDDDYYNEYDSSIDEYENDYNEEDESNDYIIEDSDRRYLTEEELKEYTKEELGYIRNEIYARYGYIFNDDKYQVYFDEKDWYERDDSFSGEWDEFNDYEKANIQLIKSLEKEDESNNYIIEDSDRRYLTKDDLSGYTKEQLGYIRNEIYARYGYVFEGSNNKYQIYFDKKDWYQKDYSFTADWQEFNDYERANIQLIKSLENKQ